MATLPRTRHLLVIVDAPCEGAGFAGTLRERLGGPDAEVLIVAPALTSRLRYWMSDEDAGMEEAGRRLGACVASCGSAGIPARGALGDADPLQALDDALRTFPADEVVIATGSEGRANWLERGLVAQARSRFEVPITHVLVDDGEARVVAHEPVERRAPARERHTVRDIALLAAAALLALLGTVLAFVFLALDVPDSVAWPLVIVFDLGLKLAAAFLVWTVFQRRPRADRLDL